VGRQAVGERSDFQSDASAALRTALSRALIFLLIALLNPFEVMQWSEQRSRDLWQRVYAHRYTLVARDQHGDASGRDRITVVYLDDETLHSLNQTRPISGGDLLDMIEDVALAGGEEGAPKAIFVDFLLTHSAPKGPSGAQMVAAIEGLRPRCAARSRDDPGLSPFQCLLGGVAALTRYDRWKASPHCRDSNLATILCIRRSGGLPLMFADPRPPSSRRKGAPISPDEVSPALDALGTVAVTVPVAVDPRHYPLASPQYSSARLGNAFRLFPAAALYAVHCDDAPATCRGNPVGKDAQRLPAWSKDYDDDVDVVWGIGGANRFTLMMDARHGGTLEQRCAPVKAKWSELAGLLARLLASGVNLPEQRPCGYANAIPYGLLQSQIAQEDVARLLGGKLVLVGGQFRDSNDVVPAAPFGQVPGVYYHAMALDNLIERGAAYPRPAGPIAGPVLDATWADALNFLALFAVAFLLALANSRLERIERPKSRAAAAAIWGELAKRAAISVLFVLALFAALLIMVSFRLIPDDFNLVAVALICLWGVAQLGWTIVQPIRTLLLKRSPFLRFWSGVFDPPKRKGRGRKA
jgi:hypothetical protein